MNVFGFHRINMQGLTLKIEKNEMPNTSVSSRSDTGFNSIGVVMMPSSLVSGEIHPGLLKV